MSKSAEHRNGQKCRKLGHSIHYNPYRHKGTAKQYRDWEDGWKSVGVKDDLG